MSKVDLSVPAQTTPLEFAPTVCACPSCQTMALFTFIGIQHWPPQVANTTGSSETTLWQCGNCATTISNIKG